MKMSRFQLCTTWHWWKTPRIRKISDYMFKKRRQPIDDNRDDREVKIIWRTFKAVRVKMFQQELWTSLKQMKKNRNLSKERYKEEPNESFRIEKYTWNKKIGERAQEQNRENSWTGKRTYINLNDREKRDKMKSLRNMQYCNKLSNICVIRFQEEENRRQVWKGTQWYNEWKYPKSGKKHKSTVARNWANPNQYKPKEILANTENLSWTDLLWKNALRNLSRQKRNSRNWNLETQ